MKKHICHFRYCRVLKQFFIFALCRPRPVPTIVVVTPSRPPQWTELPMPSVKRCLTWSSRGITRQSAIVRHTCSHVIGRRCALMGVRIYLEYICYQAVVITQFTTTAHIDCPVLDLTIFCSVQICLCLSTSVFYHANTRPRARRLVHFPTPNACGACANTVCHP